MHIAICDDNAADRKQTERLMGREADKWIAMGDPVYVITFGSLESLFANFIQFDGILIDVKGNEGMNTSEGVEKLLEMGAMSTIVINDNRENYPGIDEKILFLPKPIRVDELHETMLKVKENSLHREPTIELRGEKESLYVKEREILYAEEKGRFVFVKLVNGKIIKLYGLLESLYAEVEGIHSSFVCPSHKLMINLRHVAEASLLKVVMEDGESFSVGMAGKKLLEKSKQYK